MSQIFNSENCINWWCLLLLMLISFLLGWFLSYWFCKKSTKKSTKKTIPKNNHESKLEPLHPKTDEHAQTTFSTKKIKATKTMERSGKAVGTAALNFASFGSATESDKDDLKKISGIGPFIEQKLNTIGIYTFKQVSKFSDEDIKNVTDLIEFFPGRILRDDWRGQADILKNGDATNFSKEIGRKNVDSNKDSNES